MEEQDVIMEGTRNAMMEAAVNYIEEKFDLEDIVIIRDKINHRIEDRFNKKRKELEEEYSEEFADAYLQYLGYLENAIESKNGESFIEGLKWLCETDQWRWREKGLKNELIENCESWDEKDSTSYRYLLNFMFLIKINPYDHESSARCNVFKPDDVDGIYDWITDGGFFETIERVDRKEDERYLWIEPPTSPAVRKMITKAMNKAKEENKDYLYKCNIDTSTYNFYMGSWFPVETGHTVEIEFNGVETEAEEDIPELLNNFEKNREKEIPFSGKPEVKIYSFNIKPMDTSLDNVCDDISTHKNVEALIEKDAKEKIYRHIENDAQTKIDEVPSSAISKTNSGEIEYKVGHKVREVPEITTETEQVTDGSSVEILRSAHRKEYAIVVKEDDGGSPGDTIGKKMIQDNRGNKLLKPISGERITIELDKKIETDKTIHAVIYEDKRFKGIEKKWEEILKESLDKHTNLSLEDDEGAINERIETVLNVLRNKLDEVENIHDKEKIRNKLQEIHVKEMLELSERSLRKLNERIDSPDTLEEHLIKKGLEEWEYDEKEKPDSVVIDGKEMLPAGDLDNGDYPVKSTIRVKKSVGETTPEGGE